MKRFLTLCLALVMILATLGMTACTKEKTLYERFTEAMKSLDKMDSVDASLAMTMKMDMGGMTMEIPVTGTIKGTGLTGDNPITRTVITMEMGDTTMTEDIYSADGWDYHTSAEGNYKMRSEEEEDSSLADELPSEEIIGKATVTEKDGITTVALTLTGEEFIQYFKGLAEGISDSELSADSLTDAKFSISFNKKNQLTALSLSFKMTVSEEGIEMTTEMAMDLTINKTSGVTVEAPEGYENYEEGNGLVM